MADEPDGQVPDPPWLLHAAARLTRSGRRRRLKIADTWPWAAAIITACKRATALPQAP